MCAYCVFFWNTVGLIHIEYSNTLFVFNLLILPNDGLFIPFFAGCSSV